MYPRQGQGAASGAAAFVRPAGSRTGASVVGPCGIRICKRTGSAHGEGHLGHTIDIPVRGGSVRVEGILIGEVEGEVWSASWFAHSIN